MKNLDYFYFRESVGHLHAIIKYQTPISWYDFDIMEMKEDLTRWSSDFFFSIYIIGAKYAPILLMINLRQTT